MKKFVYRGTAYRQSHDPEAPWIVTFVAPAEEVLTWAGIPRRAEGHEIGFQRTEDPKRVEKAKKFFQLAGNNQSPTALVLGIHQVPPEGSKIATLAFDNDNDKSSQRACTLTIELPDNEPLEGVVDRLKAQIGMRLGNASTDSTTDSASSPLVATEGELEADEPDIEEPETKEPEAEEAETEDTEAEGVETEEADITEERKEIEIGRSILSKFLEKLENPVWCKESESDLREIAKPATVIDGQHRVLGAARCERNIPFTICAIFDCEWPEQVFQFTVVNYTARGIPDQFITANAAMSLTRDELTDLEGRLVQAGVKVVEYELMRVVNFDADSPFYELVNLTEKPDPTRLGYKTMVRVAKRWYEGKHNAVKKIIRNLYPDIKGKHAAGRRIERWKDGDWGVFFLTFWKEVYDKYHDEVGDNGKKLWEVGSNLLITIVLYELQERFLVNLNNQAASYFKPSSAPTAFEDLKKAVKQRAVEMLDYIPAEFFAIEWATKSLSTSAGRDVLQSALRELVDSAGKFRFKKSRLVTGIG